MYTFEIPNWVLDNVGILVGSAGAFAVLAGLFLKRRSNRKEKFARLLPGPWRTLYDRLHDRPSATQYYVLSIAQAFKRDIPDIPTIDPVGFDLILEHTYYNLGGMGDCHREIIDLLGEYVKSPEIWDV